ncbi:hypothetical protein B566_EDAN009413 [Ephemera danica]|nr:hypothetical protein B566_EDAN009413 [Ephemera danica]
MQRANSFTAEHTTPKQPSRIPTPTSSRINLNGNGTSSPILERPVTLLRRSASLRLPSTSSRRSSTPTEREVWGIGSGSWGKRQQTRRQQGLDTKPRSTATSPISPRGLSSLPFDKLSLRGDDDDDLCSERSYDSTMSMDRSTSRRRYVVHCGIGTLEHTPTSNGATYLTPTQRAAQMNRELKLRLRQAMDDIAYKDREISRLTQECVELRMNHFRNKQSSSPEPMRSRTPSYVEKDSLNSSVHSNLEQQVPTDSSYILSEVKAAGTESQIVNGGVDANDGSPCSPIDEVILTEPVIVEEDCIEAGKLDVPTHLPQPLTDSGMNMEFLSSPSNSSQTHDGCVTQQPKLQTRGICDAIFQDAFTQTMAPPSDVAGLEEQLEAAKEALIETKGAQKKRSQALLSAEEAVLLWQQASLQLSRARAVAGTSHAEVTLQFLKSAFFHLVTGSGQTPAVATKSHWKAIQSILGFTIEECKAMDNALAAGTFPGGAW